MGELSRLIKGQNVLLCLGEGVSHGLRMQVYATWETDVVIGRELWCNLALAGMAVFFVTLFYLCNLKMKKELALPKNQL